jgi:hypothetical protein
VRGLAIALVLLAAAGAAHAEPKPPPPELDARHAFGLSFGMGGEELGDTGGLQDPQFRARYAMVSPPFELEVTGDWSNWFDAKGDEEDPNERQAVREIGSAHRCRPAILPCSPRRAEPQSETQLRRGRLCSWPRSTGLRRGRQS